MSEQRKTWLVTGGSGFIGYNLVCALVAAGQRVRVLDEWSLSGAKIHQKARTYQGTILNKALLAELMVGVDVVVHLAAISSIEAVAANPLMAKRVNEDGTRNVFQAARAAGVPRVVYASSAAVYGDDPAAVKVEETIGRQLSAYAVQKRRNELDALEMLPGVAVGLRLFNVTGPGGHGVRERWMAAIAGGQPIVLQGDGNQTRDFVPVGTVASAIMAVGIVAEVPWPVINVGSGEETSLNALLEDLRGMPSIVSRASSDQTIRQPARAGDIRRSCANVARINQMLRML